MVFQLIQKLETPELCFDERLSITVQLREVLGNVNYRDAQLLDYRKPAQILSP